jgi:hypothetical protein
MKDRQTIVYWEFNIDILGPRHGEVRERRKACKLLSKKRLREIEAAALPRNCNTIYGVNDSSRIQHTSISSSVNLCTSVRWSLRLLQVRLQDH